MGATLPTPVIVLVDGDAEQQLDGLLVLLTQVTLTTASLTLKMELWHSPSVRSGEKRWSLEIDITGAPA